MLRKNATRKDNVLPQDIEMLARRLAQQIEKGSRPQPPEVSRPSRGIVLLVAKIRGRRLAEVAAELRGEQ
jgi:hypothetical protein